MTNDEVAECRNVLASHANAMVRVEAGDMMRRLTALEIACLAVIARDSSLEAWRELDRLRKTLK